MTNEEHKLFFDIIGNQRLNELIVLVKESDSLYEFLTKMRIIISEISSLRNVKAQLELLSIRFYKHVNK